MAPRCEFTFSKSFRVDKCVKEAFEEEGFIILRSLWSGAEVQKLLRFFETSPAIERNSYRYTLMIDGRTGTIVVCLSHRFLVSYVEGLTIRPFPGLENFVPAVAYHFCLNLPAAFSQPGNGLIAIPCTFSIVVVH